MGSFENPPLRTLSDVSLEKTTNEALEDQLQAELVI